MKFTELFFFLIYLSKYSCVLYGGEMQHIKKELTALMSNVLWRNIHEVWSDILIIHLFIQTKAGSARSFEQIKVNCQVQVTQRNFKLLSKLSVCVKIHAGVQNTSMFSWTNTTII